MLTPGLFLIGHPVCVLPELNIIDISDKMLSHWQRIAKYVLCIWKLWDTGHLNDLKQQQDKWQVAKES